MGVLSRIYRFNSSRYRLLEENRSFAESVPSGAMVLDAGAGLSPYRKLFEHACYESADFEQVDKEYAKSTYVCDLKDIPVEDCRFDFIVFNQVLEHVPDPHAVLSELNRILKPNGTMIYSGPLFYEEHEQPYDFYRYTQFGLRYLFSNTGFVIERLDWLEGYFGTVGYQLNCMSRYLPWMPSQLGYSVLGYSLIPIMIVLKIAFAGISVVFHGLETRLKYRGKGYPKNYIAIVRKNTAAEDVEV